MARTKKVTDLEEKGKINTRGETEKTLEKGQDHKKSQTPAGAEEKAQRENEGRTRGRKGCKAPRVSLCTTPENYQFVKVMARLSGQSITGYINFIITQYRKEHPGLYEKAVDVMKEAGMDVLEPGEYIEIGAKGNYIEYDGGADE